MSYHTNLLFRVTSHVSVQRERERDRVSGWEIGVLVVRHQHSWEHCHWSKTTRLKTAYNLDSVVTYQTYRSIYTGVIILLYQCKKESRRNWRTNNNSSSSSSILYIQKLTTPKQFVFVSLQNESNSIEPRKW